MDLFRISQTVDVNEQRNWKILLIFILLAIALHFLFFMLRLNWLITPTPAPRVEVQQIDPKKLDAIRKDWKQKSLLLQTQPKTQDSTEAPSDARYFADRNIRVEKEQRARETSPLVKPQIQKNIKGESSTQTAQNSSQSLPKKIFPQLRSLGLPLFKSLSKADPTLQNQRKPSSQAQASIHQEEGAHQYISDQALPEGSENLLNAQESVYYSFYARLYEAIGPIWQSKIREIRPNSPILPGEYLTTVDVVLDANGRLIKIDILKSSGIYLFDTAVDFSWKRIGHFPNPPRGLLNSDNIIHTGWSFIVKVGEGFQFYDLPPSRNY